MADIDLPDVPLSQEITDQQKLLNNLVARLESKQMDSPGFHSLSRLCRKSHVDVIHDPPSEAEFMWQGGNKFNELLRALLEYLMSMDFVFPLLFSANAECICGEDDQIKDRSLRFRIEATDASSKTVFRGS